jgi:hypothetical protein
MVRAELGFNARTIIVAKNRQRSLLLFLRVRSALFSPEVSQQTWTVSLYGPKVLKSA